MEENKSQIIIYQTESGETKIDVRFQDETVWFPQKKIAELFGVNVPAISKHLNNIFKENELKEHSVISILETTENDDTSFYIIFVFVALIN